jgi:hypothetical protein
MGERRIVRRRLVTEERGVAPPHHEQGHLDAAPALELEAAGLDSDSDSDSAEKAE